MHTVTIVMERLSTSTPWYMDTDEGKAALARWKEICPAASTSFTQSADHLTCTMVYDYTSEEVFLSFLATHQDEINSMKEKRTAYNSANGIFRTMTME